MMKSKTKYVFFLFILLFSATSTFAQKGKSKSKAQPKSGYDYKGPYYEGLARVKTKLKWGFVDSTGNVVVPLIYNKGTVLRKPTFDAIGEFVNGVAKILLEGEEYYMNKEGMRCDKNGKPVVN